MIVTKEKKTTNQKMETSSNMLLVNQVANDYSKLVSKYQLNF